ncbi:MAG: DedA family protein [Armatimonas sp.]
MLAKLLEAIIAWLTSLGPMAYAGLFLIIFVETGVVIFPFLPGDSLLFTVGALAAGEKPAFQLALLYPLLMAAALIGDNCNYFLGKKFGRKLFQNESSKIFKRENLTKTEAFFEKHGPKAVIMARFVPIVRTFAPFVAGMGAMTYPKFLTFSVLGATLWVGICVTAGYFFGNIPTVKKNFEVVLIAIILVSVLPMVFEYLNHRKAAKAALNTPQDPH